MDVMKETASEGPTAQSPDILSASAGQALSGKGQPEDFERTQQQESWEDPWFLAVSGNLVHANPAFVELVGALEMKDVRGRAVEEILPRAALDSGQAGSSAAAGRAGPVQFCSQLCRMDGVLIEVSVTVAETGWAGQRACLHLVRDLRERLQSEAAIRSLAAFAQYNPHPVFEFSPEGQLTYFNAAAAAMTRSLHREDPHSVLPPETQTVVRTCLASGREKAPIETTVNGRTFSWSFFPVLSNQVVHCHVTEITERQNLEAQLRHSQKLEAVGRLAGGVAHDFNNILTVIQGHIGLLRSSPGLNPAMVESLQQVSRAAERGGQLTSQLLAFSRKTDMRPVRLDLNEVLTSISMMLHRTLGEDIDYQFCYAPGLPPVFADRGMLEQVVIILAVNARDAMPRGGQLIISTSLCDVDEAHATRHLPARPGQFICLSMIDSGCGMDHVTLSRLFEPFFTTKEFGKGTGLGLAVVYGIVQQHQGWIEVQSMVGQGSTFRIYLPPCATDQAEPELQPAGGAVPGGTETLLLVEDEPPVRWIVKNVLERYGYRVLEAGGGVEALAVWHAHQEEIALLLADMVMPVGLSGQELAEKFLIQKPTLKVIYTSGYSVQVAGRDLALQDGLNFIQKPFDPEKLAWAVRKSLDT
jgi:two-component system cell cycle sensor histidine kinase/response regulator CckA